MILAREIILHKARIIQYLLDRRNFECTCQSQTSGKSEAGQRAEKEHYGH